MSLGIQLHYQDWMIDVPIQIYSDSSAARSVARRQGIGGRLRHLQTRHFCGCRAEEESSGYTHEIIAGTQNPRMVRTCGSEMVAAMTTTTNGGEHPEGCLVTNILMD